MLINILYCNLCGNDVHISSKSKHLFSGNTVKLAMRVRGCKIRQDTSSEVFNIRFFSCPVGLPSSVTFYCHSLQKHTQTNWTVLKVTHHSRKLGLFLSCGWRWPVWNIKPYQQPVRFLQSLCMAYIATAEKTSVFSLFHTGKNVRANIQNCAKHSDQCGTGE